MMSKMAACSLFVEQRSKMAVNFAFDTLLFVVCLGITVIDFNIENWAYSNRHCYVLNPVILLSSDVG